MWFIGVEVEQETIAPLLKKILDPPLGSVYVTQNTHSKWYSMNKSIKVIYINCANGKEKKKS